MASRWKGPAILGFFAWMVAGAVACKITYCQGNETPEELLAAADVVLEGEPVEIRSKLGRPLEARVYVRRLWKGRAAYEEVIVGSKHGLLSWIGERRVYALKLREGRLHQVDSCTLRFGQEELRWGLLAFPEMDRSPPSRTGFSLPPTLGLTGLEWVREATAVPALPAGWLGGELEPVEANPELPGTIRIEVSGHGDEFGSAVLWLHAEHRDSYRVLLSSPQGIRTLQLAPDRYDLHVTRAKGAGRTEFEVLPGSETTVQVVVSPPDS